MSNNPKIYIKDVKTYPNGKSKIDLENEILKLYKEVPDVKKYFQRILNPPNITSLEAEIEGYLKDQFVDKFNGNPKFRKILQKLNEGEKCGISPQKIIEFMLSIVDMSLDRTMEWSLEESFFDRLDSMFNRACKKITDLNLQTQFEQRCKDIITKCDVGYGLYDEFVWLFNKYFP